MTCHASYVARFSKSMTCHVNWRIVDTGSELRYLILGAQREGNRALTELLKPIGVTPSQAEVLSVLAAADSPLTVREIGLLLVCETGSPSRLVSTLVSAGLVARESHPE